MFHNKETIHVTDVVLNVRDLSKMRPFYENILGLTPVAKTETSETYEIADSGHTITLKEVADPIDENRREAGLYHIALLLPTKESLADFLWHMHQNNIQFGAGDHHVSEALYLTDPEGNGYEYYIDRDTSEWIWKDAHVYMTTEQVDVNALVEHRSEAGFKGLTDGTVFGHLHLRTHDLQGALPFYTETIGLDVVTNYPGALFMSDKKYHHHIAMNVWSSNKARENNEQALGLSHVYVHHPTVNESDIVSPDGIHFTLVEKIK